jgi:hypothetical protein
MPTLPSRIMNVRFVPTYPVTLAEGTGIDITTAAGTKTIGLNYAAVAATPGIADPATAQIVVYRQATGTYENARLDQLVFPAAGQRTGRGDADYTILTTDRVVALTASLTAPRSWTLPAAANVAGGTTLDIIDEAGGIGSTNTLTITRSASDTINGATTSVLSIARSGVRLISDGISKWTINVVGTPQLADGVLSADAAGRAKMADGFLSADATGRGKTADGYTNTAKLADGVLSADAAGRAKMADGFLSADATGRGKMADGFVDWSKAAAGFVVDRAYAEYTANAALSTLIPSDDTIPQVTEGTQILSVTITPKSTTNRLRIFWRGTAAASDVGNICAAAFVNGAANAVAAESNTAGSIAFRYHMTLAHEYVPGTTSAQTITIRVGAASGTVRLNGSDTARLLGGAMRSTLIVEELKA